MECFLTMSLIIHNNLSFSRHIENITKKCKRAYDRQALFPDIQPDLAIQIFINPFRRWKHHLGTHHTHHQMSKVSRNCLERSANVDAKSYEIHPLGGNESRALI